MGRWTRWIGGAVLTLALGGLALGDLGARFPGALYVFVPPAGLIKAEHFTPVAKEVEAIEAALGANLAKIASTRAPTLYLELPEPATTKPGVWTAPEAGRIVSVSCATADVNTQLTFDLVVHAGATFTSVGIPGLCGEARTTVTPTAGPMAAGDTLDLTIGTVTGAVSSLSLSFVFQPGA